VQGVVAPVQESLVLQYLPSADPAPLPREGWEGSVLQEGALLPLLVVEVLSVGAKEAPALQALAPLSVGTVAAEAQPDAAVTGFDVPRGQFRLPAQPDAAVTGFDVPRGQFRLPFQLVDWR